MPPVVFVTAYEEYALRAFQVHAFDYVLKPFDDARFRETLEQARRRLRSDGGGELTRRLSALLDDYRQIAGGTRRTERQRAAGPSVTRLTVRAQGRMRFVRVEDVDWFEASGNYVCLHVGSATHLIRGTIRGLTEQLDPSRFVRIHRSTIVNLERIREVQPWFGGDYVVILEDGQRLRVGRGYRDRLLRPFL
jgi:two-component system LytT family response regulator